MCSGLLASTETQSKPEKSGGNDNNNNSGGSMLDNSLIEQLRGEGHNPGTVVDVMYGLVDAGVPVTREAVLRALAARAARGEDEEEEEDSSLCVVCLERPRNALLMPCKHLCLCSESACSKVKQCPLCRQPVELLIDHIYL